MSSRRRRGQLLPYLFLIPLAAMVLLPFVWMLSQSLKSVSGFLHLPPELVPQPVRWSTYPTVLADFPLPRAALNSFVVASGISMLQLLTSSLAGFAFATLKFPGKNALFVLLLTGMMVPATVVLVPLFRVVQELGLLDSYAGLIVPFAFTGFGMFLVTQFCRGVPRELFYAARVDGASYFQIWRHIYLPLSTPALATLAALAFVYYWNSLVWPLLVTGREELHTLPVMLAQLVGQNATDPPLIMAAAAIATLPPLVIFLSLQRFFVNGFVTAGIK